MLNRDAHSGIERIDRDACLTLLAHDVIGRLAVVDGSTPVIFPVNYLLDGEDIVSDNIVMMSGTSMASPFVAGAIALPLEESLPLTPELKRQLMADSRVPGRTAGTFDNQWGLRLLTRIAPD